MYFKVEVIVGLKVHMIYRRIEQIVDVHNKNLVKDYLELRMLSNNLVAQVHIVQNYVIVLILPLVLHSSRYDLKLVAVL